MNDKSVLIVEDDKWLAEQHSRMLIKAGYKTTVTYHAISAIQSIDDNLPDVIILDVLLTGSTAFALLNELQSYGDTGVIPVILCTSLASELSLDKLTECGVKRILDKTTMLPCDLTAAVKAVLL